MSFASTPVQSIRFGNVISGSLVGAPVVNNTLVFMTNGASGTTTITTITQTNVTWNKWTTFSVLRKIDVWIGTVGASPGTLITLSNAPGTWFIQELNLGGVFTPDAASGGTSANTANPTTQSVTPTATNEIFLVATVARVNTYSSGPTGAWTGDPASSGSNRLAYLYAASASGSYQTDWSYTAAQDADTYMLVFSQAGSGGAPPYVGATSTQQGNGAVRGITGGSQGEFRMSADELQFRREEREKRRDFINRVNRNRRAA